MNQAIKLGRMSSQSSSIFSPLSSSSIIGGTARKGVSGVRSVQVTSSDPKQPASTKIGNMDKNFNTPEKSLDAMEESFGEGYATRSDEEGFGGVYGGGNDETNAEAKIIQDPAHHDSKQGNDVKEKEKGRNQTEAK